MKLKYTLIALVALISPLKGRAVLTNDQEKELYRFLKINQNTLKIPLFIQKMYDLKINETDKNKMLMAINPLWDDKSHTPQQVINTIRETLLPDYAPLGKRTRFEYESFTDYAPLGKRARFDSNAHSNTLPDPGVVDNTQEGNVELAEKFSKMSINDTPPLENPNQGEKKGEKERQKKENALFKSNKDNELKEITELLKNMRFD